MYRWKGTYNFRDDRKRKKKKKNKYEVDLMDLILSENRFKAV